MAIIEKIQENGRPIPSFMTGDEIEFDGPISFIGTGNIDKIEGNRVTFSINGKRFIMSKNTPDDFPSNTRTELRFEDWTVRAEL